MTEQVVDPAVSRAKFDRELAAFLKLDEQRRRRGWCVMSAEFPVIRIAFLTPNIRPAAVAVCAKIDFTNYDLWAPSVVFVDPFSDQPLRLDQITAPFFRQTPEGVQQIMQGHPGRPAFLCLPGVREYHEHPAHDGDSWLLHRGQGEGGLYFLADKISTYGSETLTQYGVQMVVQLQQGAFPP